MLCAELGGDDGFSSEVRIIDVDGSVEHGKIQNQFLCQVGKARQTDGDVMKVRVFDRWRQIGSTMRTLLKLIPM
jgi:ribosomal protein L21E